MVGSGDWTRLQLSRRRKHKTSSDPWLFQSPSPSLQDAICVVLSRLKVSNTLANMENIICRLETDYSEIPAPRDFVSLIHRTLGSLIKARKVYYTGKGYFLVHPEGSAAWQEQHRVMLARAGKVLVGGLAVWVGGLGGTPQCQVDRVVCHDL